MSSKTQTSAARAEDSNSLLSLLIIYSTTILMIAAVYQMVSFLVIDPHYTVSGVTPHEITLPRSGKAVIRADTAQTESNKALFMSHVDAPKADGATQFTQASEHIYDG